MFEFLITLFLENARFMALGSRFIASGNINSFAPDLFPIFTIALVFFCYGRQVFYKPNKGSIRITDRKFLFSQTDILPPRNITVCTTVSSLFCKLSSGFYSQGFS